MKLLLASPVNPHTGYGNDGIGLAIALSGLGVDVYLDPTHVQAPLPPAVAKLFTKRLEPPFDLLLHHTDPGQLGISAGARRCARVAVAHTMWEFSTLDNCRGRSTLRARLKDYDLVVGYDDVTTTALAPYVTGASATVQGGYWPDQWRPIERDWDTPRFSFCMVGALHQRKDPFVAVQAFKELKDEHPDEMAHVELHLKTVEPGLHKKMEEWAPGLKVHYENWTQEKLRAFYGSQNVLLAPSRGEGKNMPALEFMSTGGTVIATNWGGHRQWLSSQYAYPLDYTLAPVHSNTPRCLQARVSVATLKEQMLHCLRNRGEVQRKGEIAAQIIPQVSGWLPVLDRLFTQIADRAPQHGTELLHRLRQLAERNAPEGAAARSAQYAA